MHLLILRVTLVFAGTLAVARADVPARYTLSPSADGLRWNVVAHLPIAGSTLSMDETRPFGVAELDSSGWPGLVRGLSVRGADGWARVLQPLGAKGWRLAAPETTTLELRYTVDLAPLAREQWPAPREAAAHDSLHRSVVGRMLFVTTEAVRSAELAFEPPEGWHAYAPLPRVRGADTFGVRSPAEMTENLFLLAREAPVAVRVSGLELQAALMGHWRTAGGRVRDALLRIARSETRAMGAREPAKYLVLLLPDREHGGEAYRASFALTTEVAPDSAPAQRWANLLAHELFHQWNGWRLQGQDYAATQWFQEGFTEYMANRTLLRTGLMSEAEFRARLAEHVVRARRLQTTLVAIGNRKGPPLYSAGALVAFAWDVKLRELTGSRAGLEQVFQALLRSTANGARAYSWPDIRHALESVAHSDWQHEYDAYVAGRESLPTREVLERLGLELVDDGAGGVAVMPAAAAAPAAHRIWQDFCRRE